jgi:glutathione S-transferase
MPLVIYGHPFSSYTQKVLIALYENGTPFEFRCIGPDTPQHVAEWLRRWPLRKFPLLVDGERTVVETSIIIEYLQLAHPGPVRLLPADPMAALEVRFMDRFFDLHVMNAVQRRWTVRFAGDSRSSARMAWRWPSRSWNGLRLAGGPTGRPAWAAATDFTMADCAAAPSLFYADWTHRISGDGLPRAARLSRARCWRALRSRGPWTMRGRSGAPVPTGCA